LHDGIIEMSKLARAEKSAAGFFICAGEFSCQRLRRNLYRRSALGLSRSIRWAHGGLRGRLNIYSLGCDHYAEAMAPPCSVLLDLDGTLIDSQPGILTSCLAALRTLGHEPNEILDIKRVIGPPLEEAMQFLLQPYGDNRIAEAVLAFRQHYGESGLLGSEPYPGIDNSLREMQQGGLRLYLATSKREAFARRILEHLELVAYFDGIHGSVPSGELDHKPELLAHVLSQHDITPRAA
jgi:phosphoglycolate phosphatase